MGLRRHYCTGVSLLEMMNGHPGKGQTAKFYADARQKLHYGKRGATGRTATSENDQRLASCR